MQFSQLQLFHNYLPFAYHFSIDEFKKIKKLKNKILK
jgi:hypothetical protein